MSFVLSKTDACSRCFVGLFFSLGFVAFLTLGLCRVSFVAHLCFVGFRSLFNNIIFRGKKKLLPNVFFSFCQISLGSIPSQPLFSFSKISSISILSL